MWTAQVLHDHAIDVAGTVGPLGLRVLLMSAAIVVAGYALLRPFAGDGACADGARDDGASVPAFAGAAALLGLLLADALLLPPPAIALVLVVLTVPIVLAHRQRRHQGRAVALGRRFAPWLLTVSVGVAGVGGALPGAFGGDATPAVYSGLLVAFAGLSWLVLCVPRSRLMMITVHTQGWVLACFVIAGVTHLAGSSW